MFRRSLHRRLLLTVALIASTLAAPAFAAYQIDGHWATGRRDLTIVNTNPGFGWADAIKNAVSEWNAASADIRLT